MRLTLLPITILLACSSPRQAEPTISEIETPANSPSAEPSLFTDKNGSVYLSWIEKRDTAHFFKYSQLEGAQWSPPIEITNGNSWFVNWADYPMLSTDGNGNFIGHVLSKSATGTYTYDVNLFVSKDGNNWTNPSLLNTDGKQAEHGFVTHLPYEENIFITWLDGRNTVMEGMENMNHSNGHHGAMSIRAAMLDYNGNKINEWELDNKTCDCCQTTAAITNNGPIVIYRDRSDDEIRDMSIVRFVNGEWTSPKPIFKDDWKMAGCPVNGPRVVAIGNTLAVAWFAAPEGKAQVKVAFSKDGGETFGEPIQIDEGSPIGRVDVVLFDAENAIVSWMEKAAIKIIKINIDGTKGNTITVATSSESRSSGFPQMEKSGDHLVFAWTDDSLKIVRTAKFMLKEF